MAQWLRHWTSSSNHEVPGSYLLAVTSVHLGKARYPHCLAPRRGHKFILSLVAYLQTACLLSGHIRIKIYSDSNTILK